MLFYFKYNFQSVNSELLSLLIYIDSHILIKCCPSDETFNGARAKYNKKNPFTGFRWRVGSPVKLQISKLITFNL